MIRFSVYRLSQCLTITTNKLTTIALMVNLFFNGSHVTSLNLEPVRKNLPSRLMVDTSDLYNVSYFKLQNSAKSCLRTNQKAFADCVYNSENKWKQLYGENDLIKSSCCAFWESAECIAQLVADLCPKNQSSVYIADQELQLAKIFLSDGYCSSYQQLSDCYLPYYMIYIVSIAVSFSMVILIVGFFGLYYLKRNKSLEIAVYHHQNQLKSSRIKLPQSSLSP